MGNTSRNSYGIYSILPDGYIVNKGGFKRKLLNEPRQLSPDPTCILPYLYLGGHFTYKHPEIIERLGITHILNIASDMSPKEKAAVAIWKQNVVYKHIPIKSGVDYDITQHFEEAFQVIDHARRTNGKVLVHCKRGISRSASFVVGYIMSRYCIPARDALNFVQSMRPEASPNQNYLNRLAAYESSMCYSIYENYFTNHHAFWHASS